MPDTDPLRVLVVLGHPREASLCGALADAFAEGAAGTGALVRRLSLAGRAFELNVLGRSPRDQALEPIVEEAIALIDWADHLVFVFPTWWGTMPALLKGFLDRVLLPGRAFVECEGGTGYQGLLGGKSAHLLVTMDTPPVIHRVVYRAPGLNGLGRATLGFCGVAPVRRTVFGSVKDSTPERRSAWLARARALGLGLAQDVRGPWFRHRRRLWAWLAAFRLQFHVMAWLAYTLGAVLGLREGGHLTPATFALGLVCLFCLEVATVLTNELVDLPSDRLNRYWSPFTGGSRVLVDGRMALADLRRGALLTTAAFVAGAAVLAPAQPALPLALAVLAVLALGYTLPPLRLCWRGLGELDVAVTHGLALVLIGWLLTGGDVASPLPWLVGAPIACAVFPAILLSGVPDRPADAAVGKRTLVVRLGTVRALRLARATTLGAALLASLLALAGAAGGALTLVPIAAVPHALFQLRLLEQARRARRRDGRIDGLMASSLLYIMWFVVPPLAWTLAAG
jgi:putative NADPH-quinone reductase/1,4-dihydroxy-2-naphthoate octaprenyltransferase